MSLERVTCLPDTSGREKSGGSSPGVIMHRAEGAEVKRLTPLEVTREVTAAGER